MVVNFNVSIVLYFHAVKSHPQTMKLGLERKLKERIPEIAEVVQTLPDAPQLTEQAIQTVLDGYETPC
jgi:hypothetical protein